MKPAPTSVTLQVEHIPYSDTESKLIVGGMIVEGTVVAGMVVDELKMALILEHMVVEADNLMKN